MLTHGPAVLVGVGEPGDDGVGQHLRRCSAPAPATRRQRPGSVGVGLPVEHDGQQVGAGHAVDHAVVGLRDERPGPVLQTLHLPHLPQWTVAVEPLGHQPANESEQLGLAPRLGQGRVAHVIAEVEVGVVDPHRPAELERRDPDLLAVPRNQRELAGDVARRTHRCVGAGPSTIGDRPDVHVAHAVVLEQEERGVQRAQTIHQPSSQWRRLSGVDLLPGRRPLERRRDGRSGGSPTRGTILPERRCRGSRPRAGRPAWRGRRGWNRRPLRQRHTGPRGGPSSSRAPARSRAQPASGPPRPGPRLSGSADGHADRKDHEVRRPSVQNLDGRAPHCPLLQRPHERPPGSGRAVDADEDAAAGTRPVHVTLISLHVRPSPPCPPSRARRTGGHRSRPAPGRPEARRAPPLPWRSVGRTTRAAFAAPPGRAQLGCHEPPHEAAGRCRRSARRRPS